MQELLEWKTASMVDEVLRWLPIPDHFSWILAAMAKSQKCDVLTLSPLYVVARICFLYRTSYLIHFDILVHFLANPQYNQFQNFVVVPLEFRELMFFDW